MINVSKAFDVLGEVGEPMKRFPNIRATATYRKHGGGLVVYAREQA